VWQGFYLLWTRVVTHPGASSCSRYLLPVAFRDW